jgi:hypothetical protein
MLFFVVQEKLKNEMNKKNKELDEMRHQAIVDKESTLTKIIVFFRI